MSMLPQQQLFVWKYTILKTQSSWQALSVGQCNHLLTSRQGWPIQDWRALILFSDISREGSPNSVTLDLPHHQKGWRLELMPNLGRMSGRSPPSPKEHLRLPYLPWVFPASKGAWPTVPAHCQGLHSTVLCSMGECTWPEPNLKC